jgi:hypothetical protein
MWASNSSVGNPGAEKQRLDAKIAILLLKQGQAGSLDARTVPIACNALPAFVTQLL